MTDRYINEDIRAAEAALIALGQTEIARALIQLTHGWRNVVMGDLGQDFIKAVERISANNAADNTKNTKTILDEIGGLKDGQNALQAGFHDNFTLLAESLDELRARFSASEATIAQHGLDIARVEARAAANEAEIARVRHIVEALKAAERRSGEA